MNLSSLPCPPLSGGGGGWSMKSVGANGTMQVS